MEGSRAGPPVDGASVLVRALCLLILVLMAAAAAYGGWMALHFFRQIGV